MNKGNSRGLKVPTRSRLSLGNYADNAAKSAKTNSKPKNYKG